MRDETKCYGCGKSGHLKRDCSQNREIQKCQNYGDPGIQKPYADLRVAVISEVEECIVEERCACIVVPRVISSISVR